MTTVTPEAGAWLAGLLLVVGMVGIVVPVIPGLFICLLAVLLWAATTATTTAWVCFGVAVALFLAGLALQWLVPGRRMRQMGVGVSTLVVAVLVGIVGFFVVPVVGGPLGFVLGVFLVELSRTRDRSLAWTRTRQALRAVLTSMGIELAAAFGMALTYAVGLVLG